MSRPTETAYKAWSPGKFTQHKEEQMFAGQGDNKFLLCHVWGHNLLLFYYIMSIGSLDSTNGSKIRFLFKPMIQWMSQKSHINLHAISFFPLAPENQDGGKKHRLLRCRSLESCSSYCCQ